MTEYPIAIYQHMIERASPDELKNVQRGVISTGSEIAKSLEAVFPILEKRIASSYKTVILIYSVAGLTQFTETGRITNYFLPSFDKQERRTILEYMVVI